MILNKIHTMFKKIIIFNFCIDNSLKTLKRKKKIKFFIAVRLRKDDYSILLHICTSNNLCEMFKDIFINYIISNIRTK